MARILGCIAPVPQKPVLATQYEKKIISSQRHWQADAHEENLGHTGGASSQKLKVLLKVQGCDQTHHMGLRKVLCLDCIQATVVVLVKDSVHIIHGRLTRSCQPFHLVHPM